MARRKGFRTQAPRQATVILATILWIIGVANVIFSAFALPNNLGIWALVVSGGLLILGSFVDGI